MHPDQPSQHSGLGPQPPQYSSPPNQPPMPSGLTQPPAMPPPTPASAQLPLDERTPAYSLALRQRFTVVQNRYELVGISPSGEEQVLAFAVQKRFSLREKITFFTDESRTHVAFTIGARNVLELAATYDIIAGSGQPLASLKKEFGASLLRSTYTLSTPRGQLVVRERGQVRPILRRVISRVADLPWVLPLQFDIETPDGQTLVTVDRLWKIRDHYEIKVYEPSIEWQLVGAVAVAVDAFMQR